KKARGLLKGSGVVFPDRLFGFLDSGALSEPLIERMLKSLKSGTTELVCHPGLLGPEIPRRFKFYANCEDELAALTSSRVKGLISELGLKLVSFKDLPAISKRD
ncbi:ChbG/HpnK family deacetylase, partial [Candidatus Omnitrophota bacterium]